MCVWGGGEEGCMHVFVCSERVLVNLVIAFSSITIVLHYN